MKFIPTILAILLITSAHTWATTKEDIKCVQQGLLDAGFDPNGVDGAIGNGTKSAITRWGKAEQFNLLTFSLKTAASWCRVFQRNAPESIIPIGLYRAVFTERTNNKSINRCGMLQVDYENGHLYRYGLCDTSLENIADDPNVFETAIITVTDKNISILQAEYEVLDTKNGDMIGQWELNGYRNNFLTFKRLAE